MRLYFFIFLLFLGGPNTAQACAEIFNHPKAWFEKIDFIKIENILKNHKIVRAVPLEEALKEKGKIAVGFAIKKSILVTFKDGTQGVLKFDTWHMMAEVPAYKAARLVRYASVPPTVSRRIDKRSFSKEVPVEIVELLSGKTVSIQYFVETKIDLLKLKTWDRISLLAKTPIKQRSDRDIFSFVFGKWDLNWGNILIEESFNIADIDLGSIRDRQMVRYGEAPFVYKAYLSIPNNKKTTVTSFPFDKSKYLDHPTEEVLYNAYGKYVKNWVYDKELHDRSFHYVIWDSAVWVRFYDYAPIQPRVFSFETLEAYRKLTFAKLRRIYSEGDFTDQYIYEILGRRNQILEAAENAEKIP